MYAPRFSWVSIRSQPEGREIQYLLSKPCRYKYVSIRSQPEGREIRRTTRTLSRLYCVSIRSQPEGREILPMGGDLLAAMTFQSAPNPKVGRYLYGYTDKTYDMYVSIRSQPEGREIQRLGRMVAPLMMFQSAPNPKVGRYRNLSLMACARFMFQSAPNPKVGRYYAELDSTGFIVKFQSAPNPKVGRYVLIKPILQSKICFNPLPTRRSGDTNNAFCSSLLILYVSIRSQPEGREIQCQVILK